MAVRAKQILDDIVTLEVNTIINRNISAQKMPKPRYAMCKIATGYRRYLKALNLTLNTELPEAHSHSQTFLLLSEYTEEAIDKLKPDESDEGCFDYDQKLVLLNRIKNNCDEIINLVEQVAKNDIFFKNEKFEETSRGNLKHLSRIPFETEQLVRLRKILEIGTETIAMQTCVQLDGDVVTRINPKYATNDNPLTEQIQKIHGEGLQISIQRWQDIVTTISAFFKTLISLKQ